MTRNGKRLEIALLETIERIAYEPTLEAELQILPQLAQALIILWETC
ncbi:MAG TPA: hypothetical protein VFD57_01395 [Clostridia bacterium]|nr:hypothetical protein [Clostridia bacterium]